MQNISPQQALDTLRTIKAQLKQMEKVSWYAEVFDGEPTEVAEAYINSAINDVECWLEEQQGVTDV